MTRQTISTGLGFALLALALLLTGASRSSAVFQVTPPPLLAAPAAMPLEGWQVCRVGQEEPISGVGERQVFDLCQGEGWRVTTYCLDPGMPIPQLGETCSRISPDTFWCGAGLQQLGLLQVLETPVATPSATASSTVTLTPTFTATATITLTPAPTQATPLLDTQAAPTGTATLFPRPRAGGPGNAGYLFGTLLGAGLLLAFAWSLRAGWLPGQSGRRDR